MLPTTSVSQSAGELDREKQVSSWQSKIYRVITSPYFILQIPLIHIFIILIAGLGDQHSSRYNQFVIHHDFLGSTDYKTSLVSLLVTSFIIIIDSLFDISFSFPSKKYYQIIFGKVLCIVVTLIFVSILVYQSNFDSVLLVYSAPTSFLWLWFSYIISINSILLFLLCSTDPNIFTPWKISICSFISALYYTSRFFLSLQIGAESMRNFGVFIQVIGIGINVIYVLYWLSTTIKKEKLDWRIVDNAIVIIILIQHSLSSVILGIVYASQSVSESNYGDMTSFSISVTVYRYVVVNLLLLLPGWLYRLESIQSKVWCSLLLNRTL